jgi:hypothetical protein
MALSLLTIYGLEFYALHEVIEENEAYGVSKRIPITSIPEGLEKGASKIFCAHPHAIVRVTVEGKTLADLAYALLEEGFFTLAQWNKLVELDQPYWTGEELQPYDFVPESMLEISMALSKSENWKVLMDEFKIEFCMGVIGYTPFTGFQYIAGDNEDGLPPELEHLDGYIEPVHVVYKEDDDVKEI